MTSYFEEVGVRAVVQGAAAYVQDANRVNTATSSMNSATNAAAKAATAAEAAERKRISTLQQQSAAFAQAGRSALLLGAAIEAPGAAAIVMAANFERAITQVSTLSGVAESSLGALRQGVLELSGTTAQGPQELARGLLVVTSTGIRGAQAMDILGASAKSAAVGLGDTGDIARTITSAVTAFAAQGLTAAHASDVLFATVRDGGAEVDQVAGSLGRVIGIAAIAGLTFEDVGASVATFTRLGVDAQAATTGLRAVLLELVNPSTQAKAALADVGLSAEQLLQIARQQGLPAALQVLTNAFKGNLEGLTAVVPEARALADVLGTAGTQGQAFADILQNAKNSTGDLDRAFDQTSKTSAFRFQQALADIQRDLVELGSVALPVVSGLLGPITNLINAFGSLPKPVQEAVLAGSLLGGAFLTVAGVGGLAAASFLQMRAVLLLLGPALSSTAASAVAASAAFLLSPPGLIALGVAAVGAGVAYAVLRQRQQDAAEAAQKERDEVAATTAAREHSMEQLQQETRVLEAQIAVHRERQRAAEEEASRSSGRGATGLAAGQQAQAEAQAIRQLTGEQAINAEAIRVRTIAEGQSAEAITATVDAIKRQITADEQRIQTLSQGKSATRINADEIDRLTVNITNSKGALEVYNAAAVVHNAIQHEAGAAAGGAAKGIAGVGIEAGATAEKLISLSAEAIASLVVLNDLKALAALGPRAGANSEIDLIGQESFQRLSPEQQANDILARATALRKRLAAETQRVSNANGILTSEQKRADQEAESAAEKAAREDERRREEIARRAEREAADAISAQKRIHDAAISNLDQIGDLVISALRREAQEALDTVTATVDAQRTAYEEDFDRRVKLADEARDREVAAAEATRDARLKAIDDVANAQIAAIQAQLNAGHAQQASQERSGLVRNVALAFDPQARQQALQALQSFDQRQQEEVLRNQIETIRQQATNDKQATDDAFNGPDGILQTIRKRADANKAALDQEKKDREHAFDETLKGAQASYKAQTDDYALQAKARKLLAEGEQADIIKLLDKFAPQWHTAGISFGEQLVAGIRSQIDPYLAGLRALIPSAPGGTSSADAQRAAEIAGLQNQGKQAALSGVPQFALEPLRQTLVGLGAVPEFRNGLDVGIVRRPMLASLDVGEVVLTPQQQEQFMGGARFERGAFEGMFSGASFAGSPEENARAIRAQMEDFMEYQLGRGAFIGGAR